MQSVYTRAVPGRPQVSDHRIREGRDNGTDVVDSEQNRLNEGRDGEQELQRYLRPQQQQQQTRRYLILNQTPDDIESGGTIH